MKKLLFLATFTFIILCAAPSPAQAVECHKNVSYPEEMCLLAQLPETCTCHPGPDACHEGGGDPNCTTALDPCGCDCALVPASAYNESTYYPASSSANWKMTVRCVVPQRVPENARTIVENLDTETYYKVKTRTEYLCPSDPGKPSTCHCDRGFYDWFDPAIHECNTYTCASHVPNDTTIGFKDGYAYPRQYSDTGNCTQEGDWLWCEVVVPPSSTKLFDVAGPFNSCCDCENVRKAISCAEVVTVAWSNTGNEGDWTPVNDPNWNAVGQCRVEAFDHDVDALSHTCFDTPFASYCPDPSASIDSGPGAASSDSTPTFTFSATGPTPHPFYCRVDSDPTDMTPAPAFSSCTSPHTISALSTEGPKRFYVLMEKNASDNPRPDVYDWEYDATDPNTTIDSGPPDPDDSTTAQFTFSCTDPPCTYKCLLDEQGSYSSCTSPYTASSLTVGEEHEFYVKASDAAQNEDDSPAEYFWDVAPQTSFDSITQCWPESMFSQTVTFSSPAQDATFECWYTGNPNPQTWASCTSPKLLLSGPGSHTFKVRASTGGITDPTPAVHTWSCP